MQPIAHKRKRYFAWLLLLTLCLQRIVGYVSSEYLYALEVQTFMNREEQAIANKIKAETGAETKVEIVDEARIAYLQSLGYVTPFLFSDKVGEASYVFTIDQSFREDSVSYLAADTSPESDQFPQNRTFNNQWFPDFYFPEAHPLSNVVIRPKVQPATTNSTPLESTFVNIPTPPPKQA